MWTARLDYSDAFRSDFASLVRRSWREPTPTARTKSIPAEMREKSLLLIADMGGVLLLDIDGVISSFSHDDLVRSPIDPGTCADGLRLASTTSDLLLGLLPGLDPQFTCEVCTGLGYRSDRPCRSCRALGVTSRPEVGDSIDGPSCPLCMAWGEVEERAYRARRAKWSEGGPDRVELAVARCICFGARRIPRALFPSGLRPADERMSDLEGA